MPMLFNVAVNAEVDDADAADDVRAAKDDDADIADKDAHHHCFPLRIIFVRH